MTKKFGLSAMALVAGLSLIACGDDSSSASAEEESSSSVVDETSSPSKPSVKSSSSVASDEECDEELENCDEEESSSSKEVSSSSEKTGEEEGGDDSSNSGTSSSSEETKGDGNSSSSVEEKDGSSSSTVTVVYEEEDSYEMMANIYNSSTGLEKDELGRLMIPWGKTITIKVPNMADCMYERSDADYFSLSSSYDFTKPSTSDECSEYFYNDNGGNNTVYLKMTVKSGSIPNSNGQIISASKFNDGSNDLVKQTFALCGNEKCRSLDFAFLDEYVDYGGYEGWNSRTTAYTKRYDSEKDLIDHLEYAIFSESGLAGESAYKSISDSPKTYRALVTKPYTEVNGERVYKYQYDQITLGDVKSRTVSGKTKYYLEFTAEMFFSETELK